MEQQASTQKNMRTVPSAARRSGATAPATGAPPQRPMASGSRCCYGRRHAKASERNLNSKGRRRYNSGGTQESRRKKKKRGGGDLGGDITIKARIRHYRRPGPPLSFGPKRFCPAMEKKKMLPSLGRGARIRAGIKAATYLCCMSARPFLL